MTNANQKKERQKTIKILITIALVLIVAIIALLLFRYCSGISANANKTILELEDEAALGTLPGKTEEEIQEMLNRRIKEGEFNISINRDILVKDGKGNVSIENIENNRYLTQVDIEITQDGEYKGKLVYRSKVIKQGYFVQDATMDEILPNGTYAARASVSAYHPETHEKIGNVNVEIFVTYA
ncbi:MAG: hypothetical protein RRZ24_09645 [Clostridia bacterium]